LIKTDIHINVDIFNFALNTMKWDTMNTKW